MYTHSKMQYSTTAPSPSSSPLFSIPNELFIHVFACLPTWQDLQSLRQTCRTTYTIYQTHGLAIVNEHLTKHAVCLLSASLLSSAQTSQLPKQANKKGRLHYHPPPPTWQQRAHKAYTLASQVRILCEIFVPHMQHKAPYCSNRTCAARPYTHPKHLAQHHITRLAHTQYFLRYYAESRKPTAPSTLIKSADEALAAKSPAELLLLMRVLQLLLAYTRAPEKELLGLPTDADKPSKTQTSAQRYIGAQDLGDGWHETWTNILDAALATGLKESEIYGGKKSVLRGKCL